MQSYTERTASSAPWLGTIPSHWDCKKIGSLFSERKTKVSDKDYPPLSVAKIGVVPQLSTAVKTDAGDNRKLVCAGDFVINSRSDRKGSCGISELDGSVSLINIVLTPRNQWNGRYVHYLMRSHPFSEEYYRYGRGIVSDLWTTRFSEMKSILLPIPPRAEQDQIVRFLDWKVSEINKLIALKQKEIGLLEEVRAASLSKITRRGLVDDVALRDSGYSWLGNIPQHWHLRQFSKVAMVCTNLVAPEEHLDAIQISPASIEKNTGRIINTQTVRESGVISNNHQFHEGQILYSKVRPLLNKVTIAQYGGLCSADMYPIETSLYSKYLMYFMLSHNFLCQLSMTGNRVKMPKINQDELSGLLVLYPDHEEQIVIVQEIEKIFCKFNESIAYIKEYISSLIALKARMIADVVTGKIDVRDVKVPEYEYVGETVDFDTEDEGDDVVDTDSEAEKMED